MRKHKEFRSIAITGASSGIGYALAVELARPGVVLGLIGRHEGRLMEVADICIKKGARVLTGRLSVFDRIRLEEFLGELDAAHPIDLVIANAGVIEVLPKDGIRERPEAAMNLINSNLIGLVHTVDAAIALMLPRRRGQLVLMSSVAAVTPLPHAPIYSATKAAIEAYGDALRPRLAANGISLSIVIAGYVRTPMETSYNAIKPFRITPQAAAKKILDGCARQKPFIRIPLIFVLCATLTSRSPVWMKDLIMKWMVATPK